MEHTGKRALVLAGGGAKGSYQIGVWRALQELDWMPDIITGASVGTLNGCLFTMGKIQEAEDLWRSLEIHDVLEVPATLKPEELRAFFLDIIRSGGLNVEPLAEMIDRLIDEEAVRTSPIHFGLVMTELGSLRSVQCPIEDIPEGQLKDYMLASSACFPALRPREIDGVKYIDGGWRDNMPLDLAAAMGAGELLAVDVNGVGITRPKRMGERRTASSSMSRSMVSASGSTFRPPLRTTSRKKLFNSSGFRLSGTSSTSWISSLRQRSSASLLLPIVNRQPFSAPTLAPVIISGVQPSSCSACHTPTW